MAQSMKTTVPHERGIRKVTIEMVDGEVVTFESTGSLYLTSDLAVDVQERGNDPYGRPVPEWALFKTYYLDLHVVGYGNDTVLEIRDALR